MGKHSDAIDAMRQFQEVMKNLNQAAKQSSNPPIPAHWIMEPPRSETPVRQPFHTNKPPLLPRNTVSIASLVGVLCEPDCHQPRNFHVYAAGGSFTLSKGTHTKWSLEANSLPRAHSIFTGKLIEPHSIGFQDAKMDPEIEQAMQSFYQSLRESSHTDTPHPGEHVYSSAGEFIGEVVTAYAIGGESWSVRLRRATSRTAKVTVNAKRMAADVSLDDSMFPEPLRGIKSTSRLFVLICEDE